MIEIFFWIFLGIILYVYFGYPLLLIIIAQFRKKPINKGNITPSVSIIIAAFNEEKCIRQKLENTLALDYPKDKLEIIVASDGSTDRTNEIVKEFRDKGIKLVYNPQNRGKASIQNDAAKLASGSILVFTDAPVLLDKGALRCLLKHFSNKRVGCVVGNSTPINVNETPISYVGSIYWKYEESIIKMESLIGNLCIGSGWLFAVRWEYFTPLDAGVSDDFVLPLNVIKNGANVIYEPNAIGEDKTAAIAGSLYRSKQRIVMLDLRGLFLYRVLLNPLRFPLVSLSLVSHKMLRWFLPYFFVAVLLSNFFLLSSVFYQYTFIVQTAFYFAAITGFFLKRTRKRIMMFYIPFYFCIVNLAALVGILKLLIGKSAKRWIPYREHNDG